MRKSLLSSSIYVVLTAAALASAAAKAGDPGSESARSDADAQAQSAPPEKSDAATQLGEVQVSGYAGSLAKSVSDKRNAEVISDTISAEDIGKFPEENIAESVQRITGVQITRSNGEGQSVSIRGLDPKFTAVTLDGRVMPSPTGSRAFDMTILSADFANAVDVFKSPTADMSEGGLGGTMNIRTVSPIAYGKQRFSVIAEGNYNDQAKGTAEPHLAALYTNTWADKTWGLVVGVDYSQRRLNTEAYNAYGMQPFTPKFNADGTLAAGSPLDLNGGKPYYLQNATYLDQNIGTRSRGSFMSKLEYKPSESLELRLDALYSKFKNDTYLPANAQRQVDSLGPAVPAGVYVDPATNYVLGYSADGVDLRNNARSNYQVDTLKSFGFGGTLSFGAWTADGEVSYSRAQRLSTDFSLEVLARPSGFYNMRTDLSGIPTLGFNPTGPGRPDPMNPNSFYAIGFNGDLETPTSDQIRNAKIDLSRDLAWGWLSKLRFGVDYTDRNFATGSNQIAISPSQICSVLGCQVFTAPDNSPAFNAAPWMQMYGGSSFMSDYGGRSSFPKTWLSANPFLFLQSLPLSKILALSPLKHDSGSITSTEEKVYSAYVKLDFGSEDQRWNGNVGLRFVRTEQASTGFGPVFSEGITFDQGGARTGANKYAFQTVGNDYNEVLPSLNLSYRISDDLIARFAAAKVMQRPDLSLIAPTTSVNANVQNISGGNPNLKPYLSNQFDLSLEWYFNERSLLSAAVFYKDVSNFVVNSTSSATYPVTFVSEVGSPTRPVTFSVFQPKNGGGTKIKGIEVGYQQPFTFLPGVFKDLGAQANYTYIKADPIVVTEGQAPVPLSGVSKNSYNVGVYYENPTFGVHVLYNYRSGFVADPSSYFGDGDFGKSFGTVDVSANYNFNQWVSATASISNLTNEPLRNVTKYGISRNYELDGTRYTLGVRVSF
ncbi:MAG: TonB-dependent receptor [Rudaea sp.]|uniref:TonB-dependent receptor n=1 Tax=unclassified Rudaea TaxID=2627037 RepID=UPI0010FA0585|nr:MULTISPECIES: TonB-dependent receptor [unclassified Rudaea]MBN8887474.1 TonB-dependent receptor [Rudaea sp.]MBR0347651.1 TonB-dependent receptor [Rudaea sp.]